MLGLVGWIVLAFYPRYWLAGVFTVLFGTINFLIPERVREYSPELANSLSDDATVLTITFAIVAFGIVGIRTMIKAMKDKNDLQLAAILASARANQTNADKAPSENGVD